MWAEACNSFLKLTTAINPGITEERLPVLTSCLSSSRVHQLCKWLIMSLEHWCVRCTLHLDLI